MKLWERLTALGLTAVLTLTPALAATSEVIAEPGNVFDLGPEEQITELGAFDESGTARVVIYNSSTYQNSYYTVTTTHEGLGELIPVEGESFSSGQNRFYDETADRVGYRDDQGNILIPAIYREICNQKPLEGTLAVQNDDWHWGIVDLENRVVSDFVYQNIEVGREQDHYVVTDMSGKEGVMSPDGTLLTGIKYDFIWTKDTLADGTHVIWAHRNNEYNQICNFVVDLATGEELGSVEYYQASNPAGFRGEKLLPVYWSDNKWGYVDNSCQLVIPAQYDVAMSFKGGLAWVGKKNQEGKMMYGIINEQGELVCDYRSYTGVLDIGGEGLLGYEGWDGDLRRKGYVNAQGEEVIPVQYISIGDFRNGLAEVRKYYPDRENSGTGLIDTNGNVVLPLDYVWEWRIARYDSTSPYLWVMTRENAWSPAKIGVVKLDFDAPSLNRPSDLDTRKWWYPAAVSCLDAKVLNGTDRGFEADSLVTRATVLQTLYNLEGRPDAAGDTEAWYTNAVNWAASLGLIDAETFTEQVALRGEIKELLERYCALWDRRAEGLMQGDQYGNLMLDKELTRAEFAQILVRLLEL